MHDSKIELFHALLQDKGVSLNQLGLRDIGLERADALRAIELIQDASRSILGGDAYFRQGEEVEIAYANWHSDPKAEESHNDFVARSCRESKQYIERFPMTEKVPLFVFVLGK